MVPEGPYLWNVHLDTFITDEYHNIYKYKYARMYVLYVHEAAKKNSSTSSPTTKRGVKAGPLRKKNFY